MLEGGWGAQGRWYLWRENKWVKCFHIFVFIFEILNEFKVGIAGLKGKQYNLKDNNMLLKKEKHSP